MATKKHTSAKPDKISSSDLLELIKDVEVEDAELAKYFKVDHKQSEGFAPEVVIDRSLVTEDGLEGAGLINGANRFARWRRNRRYKKRIKNWNGVKIVAEGDSWFQYPFILKDTIDQLCDLDNFEYAIFGLSEAGDLLANIVAEDELTQAIERENPDVFLISGGGNDMVGDGRLATLVHDFKTGRKAVDYPNQKFDEFLSEIGDLYRDLFTRLLQRFPQLKIVCHGYDNAIPANGNWLGKPLASKNIKTASLQKDIVAEMIKRFNEQLISIADEFPGAVFHVDCRELIGAKSNWHDELHPKNNGYFQVAELFDKTIKQALATPAPSPELAVTAPMLPNLAVGAKPLTGLKRLGDDEFANLVTARAVESLNSKVVPPKNRSERREIEASLEKVNMQANFLPISFLEVGVKRAQSVCRIVTEVPLGMAFGSGFLIGNRNFIMTNNHVLPNPESAAASTVEFDYDQDTVEYLVKLKPEQFFITSKELDFTIVACDPATLPTSIEAVKLPRDKHLITRKEQVNIVQHPQGRRKEVALHDNTVKYVYDKAIRYSTDTEGGSSGSPVFNNNWELCALHHAGWKNEDGTAINEGIKISAIVDYLSAIDDPNMVNTIEQILKSSAVKELRPAVPGHANLSPLSIAPFNSSNGSHRQPDISVNVNQANTSVTININA